MKIRIRLTLLFTALTAAILLLFAWFIYYSASSDRRSEFYNQLQKEAMTRANVLFNTTVSPENLQTIYLQNREILSEVEVAVYDPGFNLLYHDAEDIDFVKETPEMIHEIIQQGEIRFVQVGWEVIGIRFEYEGNPYAVTAAAYDEYGYAKLRNLRNTLAFSWLMAVVVIFAAGSLFSRQALRPVSRMREKAEEITAKNLSMRLNEGNGKDELAMLAITFNHTLERLQNSFEAQKEFVSNISHELRTPLAAIMGELELKRNAAQNNNNPREVKVLESLLQDVHKLNKLTSDMMNLAKASYDRQSITFEKVRLDEILVDARNELLKNNPYQISIYLSPAPDDKDYLTREGNAYMLKIAFINLMHNGCKYSHDNSVKVNVKPSASQVVIQFVDNGIGISEEDLPNIFTPFYRGKNNNHAAGSGIGLPLAQRIIKLHSGTITISSKPNIGTTVQTRFIASPPP